MVMPGSKVQGDFELFAHLFESDLFIIFFSLFTDHGDASSQFVDVPEINEGQVVY
jgi:hypothetical protein